MQRRRLFAFALMLLSACGGGGSASGGGLPTTAVPNPTPTAAPAQTITNASGTLVDDADGRPLPGVRVALEPWTAGATPLPAPRATTGADGTFALAGAPNGQYLLVIGSDTPGGATQTTVHDNVTLSGGPQTLRAPVLPPIPTMTPKPWELDGSYRLSAVDPLTEAPCVTAFNAQRAQRSLPPTVVDEWLMENIRSANAYIQSPSFVPGQAWPENTWGWLTTGSVQNTGGTDCLTANINFAFNGSSSPYALDRRTLWFAGQFLPNDDKQKLSAVGLTEFPIDPRAVIDPNVPNWI